MLRVFCVSARRTSLGRVENHRLTESVHRICRAVSKNAPSSNLEFRDVTFRNDLLNAVITALSILPCYLGSHYYVRTQPAILCIMVLCVSLYCFMFISRASFSKRKFRLVKYYYIHVHLVSLWQLTGIAMDLLQIGVLFKFANYCYDITMICSLQDETFMLQRPACVFLSSTGEWNRA